MKINMKCVVFIMAIFFVHSGTSFSNKTRRCKLRDRVLDCSKRNLTRIPNILIEIKKNGRVEEIDLSDNFIKRLDTTSLRKIPKLRVLRLSGNSLSMKSLTKSTFFGLRHLQELYMDKNKFRGVPVHALNKLRSLQILDLRFNKIKLLRNDGFSKLKRLRFLHVFDNSETESLASSKTRRNIIRVEIGAFRNMRSLEKLELHTYDVGLNAFPDLNGTNQLTEIRLSKIDNLQLPDGFCHHKSYLRKISVGFSKMQQFPSLNKCDNLEEIDFVENTIGHISEHAFSGLRYIRNIEILQSQNTVKSIHPDAFSNLPLLKELDLSHFNLISFPNLKGTTSLRRLKLQKCSLTSVADNFCDDMKNLRNLDLTQNLLKTLPSLSNCSNLEIIDLFENSLVSLTNQFHGLEKLDFLKISENFLREIPESLFASLKKLKSLLLDHNEISHIDTNAFSKIDNLELLNISFNKLRHLPVKGLQAISTIVANGNKDMISFPTQEDLPHARRLKLDYNYHCCFFLKRVQQIKRTVAAINLKENSKWEVIDDDQALLEVDSAIFTPNISRNKNGVTSAAEVDPLIKLLQDLNNHTKLIFDMTQPMDDERATFTQFHDFADEPAFCTPTPNEFYPCEDLMGEKWLRVCVWIVFFLALLGNIAVLFVQFTNYNKLDVPRYLVMNLAFADLCLGIYLGFLAFVDINTIGDFRSHALDWQFSGSCKAAGFLAVFSSELSVYTLTTITIERFLTIKNSMYVDKRITRNQATTIMGVGWLFSIIIAALPLYSGGGVRFNDYSKYSVCLPFETETLTSRVYLMVLLGINLLAFVVILYCYIKIYLFIRGSNAWNSGDSRVARRMAVLVFTDFLCWFPIALVALSAVFKNPFITDLWISKVITIFIFPLNACANPFLYAIFTKQFRKDIIFSSRRVKDKFTNKPEIRKSLLRLPIKGSLTYSTSVRRGSSCSFLFGRRHSSKPEGESRGRTDVIPQQSFDEPEETDDYQERLTSL